MGSMDSKLRRSSEQLDCCNPKPMRAQSSTRVNLPPSLSLNHAHNESGQSRRSLDCSPRESEQQAGKLGTMRQPAIRACLGDYGTNCCCCGSPASNMDSPGHREKSQLRTLRFADPKMKDQVVDGLSDHEGKARSVPSWEKDPTPLEGWSVEEQRALLNAINLSPGEFRKGPDHRQIVFSRLIRPSRPLEGRKISDCEECYAHIQANRVVYFGPTHHKRT